MNKIVWLTIIIVIIILGIGLGAWFGMQDVGQIQNDPQGKGNLNSRDLDSLIEAKKYQEIEKLFESKSNHLEQEENSRVEARNN